MEREDSGTSLVGGTPQSAPAWYAVQVKPHREVRVHRHFAIKAIPSFLPSIEVVRFSRRRPAARLEPLFPGYLFVHLAPLERNPSCWHAVRWNPGVRLILGTGDRPVPIPDEVIAAIQARVRDLGFIRPASRFDRGARVVIRSGPLAGLEAVFDRPMSRDGRVRVLLEFLGQQRAVEVDEVDLESA